MIHASDANQESSFATKLFNPASRDTKFSPSEKLKYVVASVALGILTIGGAHATYGIYRLATGRGRKKKDMTAGNLDTSYKVDKGPRKSLVEGSEDPSEKNHEPVLKSSGGLASSQAPESTKQQLEKFKALFDAKSAEIKPLDAELENLFEQRKTASPGTSDHKAINTSIVKIEKERVKLQDARHKIFRDATALGANTSPLDWFEIDF